jgi:glycosyltransferase involved in cell wall biosynthesis
MRIAVWHNLPSGGGKRALYYHVKGLIERGHQVEAWCPSTADQNFLPLSELIEEHVLPLEWPAAEARQLFPWTLRGYRAAIKNIEALDRHCQECAEEINRGEFDLLLANPCRFYRVTSIGRYVRIPKILYLQEPQRILYEALPQLPWLALPRPKDPRWRPQHLLRFAANLVDLQALRVQAREELSSASAYDSILVNSLYSRESLLRAYGLESKVCYLGVDTELFRPTGVPRENFVVGLGGVYAGKGVDRAIRAIGTIERGARPNLVWVGDFARLPYQTQVEKLAAAIGVDLAIKVSVSDQELVELLNRARLMVYTPRLEPFGLAPLEANACGTPVVAIAEGGVREAIVDGVNGLLVGSADPNAIGESILRLLEDPALACRMGEAARNHVVENWSWKVAVDRLENSLLRSCEKERGCEAACPGRPIEGGSLP